MVESRRHQRDPYIPLGNSSNKNDSAGNSSNSKGRSTLATKTSQTNSTSLFSTLASSSMQTPQTSNSKFKQKHHLLINNDRPEFLYVKMNSTSSSTILQGNAKISNIGGAGMRDSIVSAGDGSNRGSDNRMHTKPLKSGGRRSIEEKQNKEIKVKLSETTDSVAEFISEDIIKKHMSSRGKTYPNAKLYSSNGVELDGDDILYMKTGEIVFLARHGEPFNYQQVLDRYEKLQLLGSGGFGKVYLMREKERPDQLYAVKFISLSEYLQKGADGIFEIDREAKTLRMLNSKNIIQLENYFIIGQGQKEVVLVMEYAKGGELKQYVNRKGGILPEWEVQNFMKQIINGLYSCHQKGIIHRDLKMENVLFMDKDCSHLKIVDFGIAGFCLKHLQEKTGAGTFKYMAPEVLKGDINLANPQMDIWALGIMMFIMLQGYHPFFNKKERNSKDYDIKIVMQRIINDPIVIPKAQLIKQTFALDEQGSSDTPNSSISFFSSPFTSTEDYLQTSMNLNQPKYYIQPLPENFEQIETNSFSIDDLNNARKQSFDQEIISQEELNRLPPTQFPVMTQECRDLLSKLLCKNPKERILLIDAQTHPWFDLSPQEIQLKHVNIVRKLVEDEELRIEKAKAKQQLQQSQQFQIHSSLQKRNTLNLPSYHTIFNQQASSQIGKQQYNKTPLGGGLGGTLAGAGQQLINGSRLKKLSSLTPFDNNKYQKQNSVLTNQSSGNGGGYLERKQSKPLHSGLSSSSGARASSIGNSKAGSSINPQSRVGQNNLLHNKFQPIKEFDLDQEETQQHQNPQLQDKQVPNVNKQKRQSVMSPHKKDQVQYKFNERKKL